MSQTGKNNPTLMNNLGQFVGHIVKGIRTGVGEEAQRPSDEATKGEDGGAAVVREVVQEQEAIGPDGQRLILRRRTIDEVVLPDDGAGARKAADR